MSIPIPIVLSLVGNQILTIYFILLPVVTVSRIEEQEIKTF